MFDSASSSPGFDESYIADLSAEELSLLEWRMRWKSLGRPKQHAPTREWDTWGILTGRGFGKTLAGSHWVGIESASHPNTFSCVIAPTLDDVRYTNFEGPTGIIAVMPPNLILDYNKSDLIIYLWNGSLIRGFGSEKPARLRGPQFHRMWADELAAWVNQDEVWDMAEFGLRLGDLPQIMWTTTPKPLPIVKRLVDLARKDPARNIVVRGSTDENRDNLTRKYYERVARYKGTKIGRQELEGELIDPEESGIVQRSQFRLWGHDKPLPRFIHVVYSLDTAFTERTFDSKRHEPDPSGCLVFGLFEYRKLLHVMVLDCWQAWLMFPDLVDKVKKDMKISYGEIDAPILQDSIIPSRYTNNPVLMGKFIDVLLIEDKGSGISLRQSLGMENIFMYPYNPGRADKLARLHTITPMMAHGRVWLVESSINPGQCKNWYEIDVVPGDVAHGEEERQIPGFIPQVCTFHGPGTTDHDEYVDTFSQGLKYFMDKFILSFVNSDSEEEQLAMKNEEEKIAAMEESYANPYS